MSLGTKNPVRMLGGNVSGGPNTGEFLTVRGGTRRGGIWSGGIHTTGFGVVTAGGNSFNLWSGSPGRLNSVFLHNTGSGNIILYDAAAIIASGVGVSGFPIIGIALSPQIANGVSGITVSYPPINPVNIDFPFFSGLWLQAGSGTAGISVSWTVEFDPTTPV